MGRKRAALIRVLTVNKRLRAVRSYGREGEGQRLCSERLSVTYPIGPVVYTDCWADRRDEREGLRPVLRQRQYL